MEHNLSPEQFRAVVGALERKNKIEAVKVYREATGLSLAECLKAVEAIPHPSTIPTQPTRPGRKFSSPHDPASPGLAPGKLAAVLDAIRRKRKIEAIKIYREATGLGLAESKKAVVALEASEAATGVSPAFGERNPLPHWDPFAEKKKGCFGMIAVLVGVLVGVIAGVVLRLW